MKYQSPKTATDHTNVVDQDHNTAMQTDEELPAYEEMVLDTNKQKTSSLFITD